MASSTAFLREAPDWIRPLTPPLVCRACGSSRVRRFGAIPDAGEFAGKALSEPLPGGHLARCEDCQLLFRFPILSRQVYDQLYRDGATQQWSAPEVARHDHQLIVEVIARHRSAGRVLDVGCHTGALLLRLPPGFGRFGIEINAGAAALAEKAGVTIVAGNLSELESVAGSFDVAIACDVIEHLENPLAFLRSLLAVVADGGLVVISSGNAAAPLWRMLRSRYWYCYFPEHISFVSPRWFGANALTLGAEIEEFTPFAYACRGGWWRKAYDLSCACLYAVAPAFFSGLRFRLKHGWVEPGAGRLSRLNAPPSPSSLQDHFIAVLRKAPREGAG